MTRPWVTPQEVIAYTDIDAVAQRSATKLAIDISMAESYVISYTRNDFSDDEYATAIPDAVHNAVLILAEAYAKAAILGAASADAMAGAGGLKSETFDEYSYTVSDGSYSFSASSLGVDVLLDPYVLKEAQGTVTMRLRKL